MKEEKMSGGDPLSNVPAIFKPVQHYLKTAQEHDKRDPAVAYYCRLYAMQKAMEIDRKSPESRNFLTVLMNYLEQTKKACKDNEAIQNEVVGQAHVENYALKLFVHADTEDRAARFGKNVVKLFYTAGMLMDVLATFGEITEEIEKNRKYAKWKAAYIHNCLKNGETPHPGPLEGEEGYEEDLGGATNDMNNLSMHGSNQPTGFDAGPGFNPAGHGFNPTQPGFNPGGYGGAQGGFDGPPMPAPRPQPSPDPSPSRHQPPPSAPAASRATPGAASGSLKPEDFTKAMKFCRYATSALQYEDAKTAIDNLTKALNLLTTGHE